MMSKKKAFVLRLHPDVMKRLEKWAADDFRSVNGQIEWIIDISLKEAGRMNKPVSDKEGDCDTENSEN